MNTNLISIIIRTKNEQKWISYCLAAISRQTLKNVEVIIVDNESSDGTLDEIKYFTDSFMRIEVVNYASPFYPGDAINAGIKYSIGETIVILSGHCIPVDNFWLENLTRALDDTAIAGVYGRQKALPFSSALNKRDLAITFGLDARTQVKDPFFHNANSAFRRHLWEQYPFDPVVTNIEDRVWGAEVIKDGYKIYYEPTAAVFHHHGIHHDANPERAESIVKIMEKIGTEKISMNQPYLKTSNDEKLKVIALIPIKGPALKQQGEFLLKNLYLELRKSSRIKDVFVCTDTQETAQIAKDLGMKAPFLRPSKLSEDYVTIEQVLSASLRKIEESYGLVDAVFTLEETHQFRDEGMIDEMIDKFVIEDLDTVMAAKNEFRPLWRIVGDKYEKIGNHYLTPRKFNDTPVVAGLLGAGCITRSVLLRQGRLIGPRLGLYLIKHPLAATEYREED